MIGAILLAAAVPVETAERAFASMAQTKGQWTAFRAFAAPDATMLLDGPQPAGPFLATLKDPPEAVMWWPARTVTSCDGTLAFSTGPWRRHGGAETGRYNTIWRRDPAGWHWVFDAGSSATAGEGAGIPAGDRTAATKGLKCRTPIWPSVEAGEVAGGRSADDSLRWRVDRAAQGYRLRVYFSPGSRPMLVADAIVH